MGNRNRKKKIKQEKLKTKEIEDMMKKDNEETAKTVNLLILGTGESGKSTFLKQLMILYKGGFTENDNEVYKKAIKTNLISHMKILIQAIGDLGIEVKEETQETIQKFVPKSYFSAEDLTPKVVEQIKVMWKDPGFQEAFKRRIEFQLPDTADYYFDNCERIVESDYSPTERDILLCRIPTTGVNSLNFKIGNIPWKVIDVGGQRSERRKWIHQFEGVTLILYVVASSEYDQNLYEDETVNRMHESLNLFDQTANGKFFKEKNCVILFNKIDLLQEKIVKTGLEICFPKYNGGKNYDNAIKFIQNKFVKVGTNRSRSIFCHFTCATDTENARGVFDAVTSTILEEQLKEGGYI
ncbi:guanine nucleotide-binding protein g(o) subunit alpha [Anaeramoeba flamelloides]|uniref:Guanine nucleotide-binding protein g(O) subunit alpha n=1 Tax=Anaeramoeba flamelloides TaxID=1746091 RepID=A0AAV7ZSN9_9EUKA|nr:guanine nucleotide-binding protein g(o) subunit alpha [Anaeramoeba flamelloides]KAJ6233331.1 guanine nucleotide-binding protein g(o) subunit alpha [Anaeramoeba flamelloides]